MDFIQATLNLCFESELKQSKLDQLEPVQILFHSGYLTIAEIIKNNRRRNTKSEDSTFYTFTLPNYELSSICYSNILSTIINLRKHNELETNGKVLREAFLQKDAKTISLIFSDYLSRIADFQILENAHTFNDFVQFILLALGFDDINTFPGNKSGKDLCYKINDKAYVIFTIKHVTKVDKLTRADKTEILARLALRELTPSIKTKYIIAAVKYKLETWKVNKLIRESPKELISQAEKEKFLFNTALQVLSKDEINRVLAKAARESLNQRQIEKAYVKALVHLKSTPIEIDKSLKSTAKSAKKDINTKLYQSIIGDDNKEIITMRLTIYGYCTDVYAEFVS
jgi:hypothetical protein